MSGSQILSRGPRVWHNRDLLALPQWGWGPAGRRGGRWAIGVRAEGRGRQGGPGVHRMTSPTAKSIGVVHRLSVKAQLRPLGFDFEKPAGSFVGSHQINNNSRQLCPLQ